MENQNNNETQPVEIIIRDTLPSDYDAVSAIFRKEYGEDYLNTDVYAPDTFADFISRKDVHSIVAETADGRIAGHHVLREWSDIPGIYEGGMAVVNPEIRKCGAFNKMMAANNAYFDNEIRHGVVFSGAATVHDITQKARLKFNFTPCGFLFNLCPKGFKFENFAVPSLRIGEACSVHVADHSPKTIYAAEEAKKLINAVCDGENLPRTIITGEVDISEDATLINEEITTGNAISKAVISAIGKDYKFVLKKLVRDLKINESDVCHLFIPIDKPGAVSVYEEAKSYGMHLTAYIPNTGLGDFLVLGYELNNIIEYDKYVTYGPFKDMIELVRQYDPLDF